MKNSKKTLIFASVILILAILVGCTGSPLIIDGVSKPNEASKTNDTVNDVDALLNAQQWVDSIEGVDYKGYEFVVATTKEKVFLAEEEGSIIDEAKLKRNEMVEEKFKIKIVEKLYDSEELLPSQSVAALVGDTIADVVAAPAEQLSVLADNSLLLNLYSVPYLNMNGRYVNDVTKTQYTAKNTAYMMFDDLVPYQTNLWAVFYNVNMANSLGLGDPYTHVKEGTWTWDLMLQMAKTASAGLEDKDEDEIDLKTDVFGLSTYYNGEDDLDLAYALLGSMGGKFFGDTYKKDMALSLDMDVGNKAVETVLSIKDSNFQFSGDGMEAITAFSEGRILFYVYEASLAAAIANSKTEWSIAPLPKYSVEQEGYNSWLDLSAMAIGVFDTNKDTPRVGRILNCLCAASYEHIAEATNMAYLNYYLRNNASALMLTEYVFKNPFLDVTYLYGMGMEELKLESFGIYGDAILEGSRFERKLYDEENVELINSYVAEKFK